MLSWLQLVFGLVVLYLGAQALRLGLTPLVIGLTVIAYGTSSPEMVVSLQASLAGNASISIGNLVGSNICNVALIIGLCAVIRPVGVSAPIIRREIPIMIAVSLLTVGFLFDGTLARWEGALLLLGCVLYTVTALRGGHASTATATEAEFSAELPARAAVPGWLQPAGLTLLGLVLLVAGSHFFVLGAVDIATSWGVRQIVVGLTIVAIGTSLPELATSLVAALRGHSDVAVGNVVGSNVFNLLGILGLCAVVKPLDTSGLGWVDLIVMLGVAVALLPLAKSGGRISRLEGTALLLVYAGYTTWLITQAT